MNGHAYLNYNGKKVEMYETYMNTWKESWGEFYTGLSTPAQVINRVSKSDDFETYQECADHCRRQMERAAARYETVRAKVTKRDRISLRCLVETTNSVANWSAAADHFDNEASIDRIESGLLDLHETPHTTGYYGD